MYIYIYNISKKICERRIQELQQLLSRIMIRVSKGFLASDSNSPRGWRRALTVRTRGCGLPGLFAAWNFQFKLESRYSVSLETKATKSLLPALTGLSSEYRRTWTCYMRVSRATLTRIKIRDNSEFRRERVAFRGALYVSYRFSRVAPLNPLV